MAIIKRKPQPSQGSAQYCRACNTTHDADGCCGQHDLEFRKVMHTLKKRNKPEKRHP